MEIDFSLLDGVLKKTIETMEDSKYQIFEIAEQGREELNRIHEDITLIRAEVLELIHEQEQLEQAFKRERMRLSEVSRNFKKYTEEDIRMAYEAASKIQIDLTILQEKEKQLRERRNDLQYRAKALEQNIEKASNVLTQINVVQEYLSGDVHEMTKAFKDAHNSQQLGLKVIQSQEEERKRLSREIHDGPAQNMAHLVLRMDLVEKLVAQQNYENAKCELEKLKESARDSLSEIRKIIFDLRPMALDDLGLVPTLKKYVDKLAERERIEFNLKTFGEEVRLPPAFEVAMFRLIQESLTNIVKHSKASQAMIKIESKAGQVISVIEDNGVGFSTDKQKNTDGFGLMGMQERVKLLQGEVTIQSQMGKGTKVIIKIPIEGSNREENKDVSNQRNHHFAY